MLDLDALTKEAYNLDPLPPSAAKLASIAAQDEPDFEEVTHLIKFDQALTLRVLKAANSAMSGGRNKITTVPIALSRLGVGSVAALAVASGASKSMKNALPQYGLEEGMLWRHSVASAVTPEVLIRVGVLDVPMESFTTALLHDIGKLILGRVLSDEHQRLLSDARKNGGCNKLQAEREILGVDHGELGGLIAQHWDLPESVVKGITYHHAPAESNLPICWVTNISNLMAHAIEDDTEDETITQGIETALTALGSKPDKNERIQELVKDKLDAVVAQYG